jgi:hypothetical protein
MLLARLWEMFSAAVAITRVREGEVWCGRGGEDIFGGLRSILVSNSCEVRLLE